MIFGLFIQTTKFTIVPKYRITVDISKICNKKICKNPNAFDIIKKMYKNKNIHWRSIAQNKSCVKLIKSDIINMKLDTYCRFNHGRLYEQSKLKWYHLSKNINITKTMRKQIILHREYAYTHADFRACIINDYWFAANPSNIKYIKNNSLYINDGLFLNPKVFSLANKDPEIFARMSCPEIYHLLLQNKNTNINFINKIKWDYISSFILMTEDYIYANPSMIKFINNNTDKINWKFLSKNPAAINLLKNNMDKINWANLSENPAIFNVNKLLYIKNINRFISMVDI